jgi:hypothetical protein
MYEWVVGYRDESGEIKISGLSKSFYNPEEADEWFEYLCGPWRKELEEKAAEEDLKKTNWATMTLARKKKEQHVLLKREITPYTIEREAPKWE